MTKRKNKLSPIRIKLGIGARAKQVLCTTTGKAFKTIAEAVDYYDVPGGRTRIIQVCKGRIGAYSAGIHKGMKLRWKYITLEEYLEYINN